MTEDIIRELLNNPNENYDRVISTLSNKYTELSKDQILLLLLQFLKKREEEKKDQELVTRQEDYNSSILLSKVLTDISSDTIDRDQKRNIREAHNKIKNNDQCDSRTEFIEVLDDTLNEIDSSTNGRDYIISNIKSGGMEP